MATKGTHRFGIAATLLSVLAIALLLPATSLATGSVTTGSATVITATTATLTGTISGADSDSEYAFQYGTTTAYGHISPAKAATAGSSTVSVLISGLTANTAYHYRLILVDAAADPATATAGADATFTTNPAFKASAVTGVANKKTTTAATVYATLKLPVAGAYRIQYGSGTFSKASSAKTVSAGSHKVSVRLTGLKPGTKYQYRVVVAYAPSGSAQVITGRTRHFYTAKKKKS